MEVRTDQQGSSKVAVIDSDGVVVGSAQDALDLMASIRYEYDCRKIVLRQEHLTERFFELSSGIAGDILQKYVNYRVKLAIVGEFDRYGSKSLRDFIYECNQGSQVFFVPDERTALERLHALA